MLASEMTGIPYSFTLHGPAIFFEPMWWRVDEKIRRARFVVCISHFARSQAMLFSDQECWAKLKIVHCGVTPSNYGRSDHETGVRRVLFVGRLAAVKGVPLLLQAFSALSARHPEARLVIVGDGPDRAALEAQADRLGIAGLTEFLGYQPQEVVAEELRRSEVLVLPSFAEGVPIVLMEAMASRIPVIASRVAGVPELVEDGVSGYLIPPGDVSALTARLESLVADPELCARMGEAGRRKVETEFDVDVEAGKLAGLFAGLDDFEANSAEYGQN
jgi:glycosyltransferase involved in cell wall biosynthesis